MTRPSRTRRIAALAAALSAAATLSACDRERPPVLPQTPGNAPAGTPSPGASGTPAAPNASTGPAAGSTAPGAGTAPPTPAPGASR